MKTTGKTKRARGIKRNLLGELREGMIALAEEREGKRTRRTHAVEYKPEKTPDPIIIIPTVAS